MKGTVILFILFLLLISGGAFYLTVTGAWLPGPDDGERLSLRNESRSGSTRRAHFFATGFYGK